MPGALLRLFFSRRIRDIRRQQTQDERLASFYHYYLSAEHPAKEVKLFHLGHLFRERYRDLRTRLRVGRLAIIRRREYADFLGQGFATVALFGSLGYVALSTLRGVIGLNDWERNVDQDILINLELETDTRQAGGLSAPAHRP